MPQLSRTMRTFRANCCQRASSLLDAIAAYLAAVASLPAVVAPAAPALLAAATPAALKVQSTARSSSLTGTKIPAGHVATPAQSCLDQPADLTAWISWLTAACASPYSMRV